MCKTKVDDFIGTTFPTPKGGVLTVTGWDGERSGGCKKYTVECSICSKDKELFPKGFKSGKGNLVQGCVPCGCYKRYVYSKTQYKTLVKRCCAKKGYTWRILRGDFKDIFTKVHLHNPVTDNTWTWTIDELLKGRCDPFIEKSQKQSSFDNKCISEFISTGSFTEGTTFTHITKEQGCLDYWEVTCPLCSKDEYVQLGLCSGVFISTTFSLKSGCRVCRCKKNFPWTQKQREYQLRKICKEEGSVFSGWATKGEYLYSSSKFKWVCSKGHDLTTSVSSFLQGNRCLKCKKIKDKESGAFYGYYPLRTEEADSLYILDFGGKYIKVGRSFDIARRVVELRKQSGIQNITTLYTVKGTHQEVYDLEQALHEHLEDRGFSYTPDWGSVECFDSDSLSLVYKLIDEDINDSSNTLEEGEW